DQELLAVYLEEAGDVLSNIDKMLAQSRAQPQDLEALTTIRRGFHTLKGSGRMVGLIDLGEVAWEIEQVMNRWMQMKWPASPELLELIGRGSAAFAGWIAELKAGTLAAEIAAQEIVDMATRLRAAQAPAPVTIDPSLEKTVLPEEVTVGEVRLGRAMF